MPFKDVCGKLGLTEIIQIPKKAIFSLVFKPVTQKMFVKNGLTPAKCTITEKLVHYGHLIHPSVLLK